MGGVADEEVLAGGLIVGEQVVGDVGDGVLPECGLAWGSGAEPGELPGAGLLTGQVSGGLVQEGRPQEGCLQGGVVGGGPVGPVGQSMDEDVSGSEEFVEALTSSSLSNSTDLLLRPPSGP